MHDDIPRREHRHGSLHVDIENALENLACALLSFLRRRFVEANLWRMDFLDILFMRQLIDITMADHIILWIEHRGFIGGLYAKTGGTDHSGHPHKRFDNKVGGHVSPSIQCPPQIGLQPLAEFVLTAQSQFVVHIHLVPGNLVNHDHGSHRR